MTAENIDLDIEVELTSLRVGDPPDSLREGVLISLDLADRYFLMSTIFGPTYFAFNSKGISAVELAEERTAFEQQFRGHFGRPAIPVEEPPSRLVEQINRRLEGERVPGPRFDLRSVTEFERDVLMKALEIPFGQVRPYGWIASQIGRPKAVRAVGSALAGNPIPLLIPCHRVVRSDGDHRQLRNGRTRRQTTDPRVRRGRDQRAGSPSSPRDSLLG